MKKKYLAILVAVVGVMGAAIGGTMSYMTETEEVTNVFTVGDLDMGQNETDWELTGTNGKDVYPGYTAYKNPTIKNISDTTNGEEPADGLGDNHVDVFGFAVANHPLPLYLR